MADASDSGRLRRFLRTVPHPSKVRVELAGGRPSVTLVLARTNTNKFAECEKSIRAMGEDVLTVAALDVQGETLRVHRLRDEADEVIAAQKEPWPVSPDAQMAQVITASNDRAASRHENAWRMAFDKLHAMYEAVLAQYNNEVRRTAQLEAALQRELARREVALPEDEEGLNGLIAQVAAEVIPKLLNASNPKTNGAPSAKE